MLSTEKLYRLQLAMNMNSTAAFLPKTIVLFGLIAILGLTLPLRGEERPCFAFLRYGDVTVSCGGKTTAITHRGDIGSFATGGVQPSLAYTTSRVLRKAGATETLASTAHIIDLTSGANRQVVGVRRVVGSCGSVMGMTSPTGGLRDLLADSDLVYRPYQGFRCSSDRNTVAGVDRGRNGDLMSGLPPQTTVALARDFGRESFSVSPDGTYIAFTNGKICVTSRTGTGNCVEVNATLAGAPSVSNTGEVLFARGTNRECYYKTQWNYSPERFAGATEASRDECLGIGHWTPGSNEVVLAEPLGRDPQWISPAIADLLRRWGSRTADSKPRNGVGGRPY